MARDMPMTPAERRAVAKAVRTLRPRSVVLLSDAEIAANRKERERQRLAAKIKAGEFISAADRKRAVRAGVGFGETHGLVGKTVSNLVEAGVYALPGMLHSSQQVIRDLGDMRRGDIDFERTRRLGGQVARSTYETARHPLRRPGDTLLLGFSLFSGGASLAARAAAGTVRKPPPPLRKLTLGEAEAQGTFSKNPGRALIQGWSHDRAIRRFEAGKPEALNRKFAKYGARNRMIEEEAGRAAERTVRKAGRKATAAQNMALRAYIENTPLDDRMALAVAELGKAATPRARRRLRREIGLIKAAGAYVRRDPDTGNVEFTEFMPPRKRVRKGMSTEQIDVQAGRILRGGARREKQGADLGLLKPTQARARRDQPGRIMRGARFVPSTEALARLRSIGLERRRTLEPGATEQIVETTRRPRTKQEAATRLSGLESALNPLISEWAKTVRGEIKEAGKGRGKAIKSKDEWVSERHGKKGREVDLPAEDQAVWEREQFGYAQGDKDGYRNRHANSPEEIAEEMLSQVSGRDPRMKLDLNTLLAVRAELEGQGIDLAKLRKALDERDDLIQKLAAAVPDPDEAFGTGPATAMTKPDYGTVAQHRRETVPREPDWDRLAALDAEARSLRAASRRGAIVGGEPGPRARGYLGYGSRGALRDIAQKPFVSRSGARPKPTGGLARSLKQFQGANLRTADYQHDTSRVAATGMAAMNRHHNAIRVNERLFAAGVPERPADTLRTRYVPVRDRDLPPAAMKKLRDLAQKIDDDTPLTGEEKVAYEQALRDLETPEVATEALDLGVGESIAGVRWVPRIVFDKISQAGQTTGSVPQHFSTRQLKRVWDEFNSGMRGIVLYSKGAGAGYVTPNLLANVLLLGLQGGPKAMAATIRSLKPSFRKAVGEDAMQAAKSRMGEGFMTSTFADQAGRGPVSATVKAWGRALGKVTDEQTRFGALVFEAAERGFRSPAQFRALMLDPKHADDAMDATIRARDAALDYELMSPAERSALASWFFVYPFVRASSRYAVNFPLDHPHQAALYAQLAQIAQGENQLGQLDPMNRGLVKTGERRGPGGTGRIPEAVNSNALSPFQAGPEVVETVGGFLNPRGPEQGRALIDLASPPVVAGIETLAGHDSFSGRPVDRTAGGFLGQVFEQFPTVRDVRQVRKSDDDRAKQTRPRTPRDVALSQVFGSVTPGPYNPKIAAKYQQQDERAAKPPVTRARIRVFDERRRVLEALRANHPERLENGRLPAPARQAFNRLAEVEAVRKRAELDADGDKLAYRQKVIVSEAKLLERWGAVPKGTARQVAREARAADLDRLDTALRRLRDRYMPAAYRDITSEATKYADHYASS